MAWLLGIAYALLVPRGLAQDEPAHWQMVQFYARHVGLARINSPGANYEAQQAPLYYYVASLLVRLLGTGHVGFYGVRIMSSLLIPVFALQTWSLGRRLHAPSSVLVTVLVAFNPVVLAILASIQNDGLAIVLGTGSLLALVRADDGDRSGPDLRWTGAAGVLAGLSLLSKITEVYLPAALALYLVLRWRRRAALPVAVVAAPVLAIVGWWLVRNVVVYGDVTAQKGLTAAGYSFPPEPINSMGSAGALGKNVLAWLWLPVEYYRSIDPAPLLVRLVTIVLTVVGGLSAIRARGTVAPGAASARRIASIAVGVGIVLFLVERSFVNAVAPRIVFSILPVVAVWLGGGWQRLLGNKALPALSLTLLALSGWVLVKAVTLPAEPFLLT